MTWKACTVVETADACDRLKGVDIKIALNGVNHITYLHLADEEWQERGSADVVGIKASQV